jgi:hypothetical protein
MKHYLIKLVCLLGVLLMFAACKHVQDKPATEETLRQMVQTEWEARVSRKLGVVYDMTVKSFQKAVPRDAFLQRPNMPITSFSVKEVKLAESGKEGQTVVQFKTNQMGFDFNFTTKENWIWEDGDWRLNISPSKVKIPFGKTEKK